MLELKNLSLKAGSFEIKNLNLNIEESDYFMILGESGAGKSLLLKSICGLVKQDSGEIRLDGENLIKMPTHKRNIGLVHQDLALFTHLNVFENIAYGLKYRKISKAEIKNQVEELAKEFEIDRLLTRRISKLSGGEKQRVALARTLAQKPKIILLDEPLSSVDASISNEIKKLLRKINRRGQTIIHVTHHYEEALSLASKIAVIENGAIIQEGSPNEVFNSPKSKFLANLTGLDNFYQAKIIEKNKAEIDNGILINLPETEIGKIGFISFHSHDVIISENPLSSSMMNNFKGKITDISNSKNGIKLTIDAGFQVYASILDQTLNTMQLKIGSDIWIHFKATAVRFID